MAKFYLEEPNLKRKLQAVEYIEEHFQCKSNINGSGGLDKGYIQYEEWLKSDELKRKQETCPKNLCPGYTYFLIREEDDELIGMIDIRYNLNDAMLQSGGHIGYGIRPSERNKGYNKINLYLGLQKCKEVGLDNVLLIASDSNPASYRTIISLGGILENKLFDYEDNSMMGRYWIDVNKSLNIYKEEYIDYIKIEKLRNK